MVAVAFHSNGVKLPCPELPSDLSKILYPLFQNNLVEVKFVRQISSSLNGASFSNY